MAANATFALNAAGCFRRARLLIVSPDSSGTACPLSGRNSTYRPVQNSGASSTAFERQRSAPMWELHADRLKQTGIPVKIEELFLAAGEPTYVDNLVGIDAHSLERW